MVAQSDPVEAPVVPDHLKGILDGILPVHETSDMKLVVRIRRIIEEDIREAAELCHRHLSLWYHDMLDRTGQCFWTENHMIMSSSCDYLLREYLEVGVDVALERRLLAYLDLKLKLGMAEFLSPVYWPFTITALLNLYDYSHNETIKQKAQALLDNMATQVLSVVLSDGSFISPSGRSYARHRERTTDHHLSIFITYLITRQNIIPPPGEPEMALREACRSTKWLPSERAYVHFRQEVVDTELSLSPDWTQLFEYLHQQQDMTLEERVSTLWSHGAYFHPQAMVDVLAFMDGRNLWAHPHFAAAAPLRRAMCCCPQLLLGGFLSCIASSCLVRPFAMGALLTGAGLAVHKEGKVLLSSLSHNFNAGLPAFQQWPWAVNLAGVPIWCSFGHVGGGGLRGLGNSHTAGEMSTARVMPRMQQDGNTLSALYLSRTCVQALWNRKLRPRVRWDEILKDVDEHGTFEVKPRPRGMVGATIGLCKSKKSSKPMVWHWARKESAVICQTVVGLEVLVVVRDLGVAKMASVDEFQHEVTAAYGLPRHGSKIDRGVSV